MRNQWHKSEGAASVSVFLQPQVYRMAAKKSAVKDVSDMVCQKVCWRLKQLQEGFTVWWEQHLGFLPSEYTHRMCSNLFLLFHHKRIFRCFSSAPGETQTTNLPFGHKPRTHNESNYDFSGSDRTYWCSKESLSYLIISNHRSRWQVTTFCSGLICFLSAFACIAFNFNISAIVKS